MKIINLIDDSCAYSTSFIFFILKYILFPLKIIFKFITNYFQRPYSLIFFIDFLLLMTPTLLLTILLIQNSHFINSLDYFNRSFYVTLITLILNYISVFHIYHLYGLHKILEERINFNIKSFSKFAISYLFEDTKSGVLGIIYFFQVNMHFYSLNYINSQENFFLDTFERPIVVQITRLAIILEIVFLLMHIAIYFFLFLFILCKINRSCIFKVISDMFRKKLNELRKIEEEDKGENIDSGDTYQGNKFIHYFQNSAMEFYKFIRVYDYEKELYCNKDYDVENI